MCGKASRFSGGVVCGMSGDLVAPFSAKLEGFRGTAGAAGTSGDRVGEVGRLLKLSTLGIGVLDGRGPGSRGRIGNGLTTCNGDSLVIGESRSTGLSAGNECLLDPVAKDVTMGSFKASISSSSSIEGNA